MSVVTSFESLFYLTIIGCHFPPLFKRAYGWASQGLRFYDKRADRKYQNMKLRNGLYTFFFCPEAINGYKTKEKWMDRVVGLRMEQMVNTRTCFEVFHSMYPYISKHLLIVPTKCTVLILDIIL